MAATASACVSGSLAWRQAAVATVAAAADATWRHSGRSRPLPPTWARHRVWGPDRGHHLGMVTLPMELGGSQGPEFRLHYPHFESQGSSGAARSHFGRVAPGCASEALREVSGSRLVAVHAQAGPEQGRARWGHGSDGARRASSRGGPAGAELGQGRQRQQQQQQQQHKEQKRGHKQAQEREPAAVLLRHEDAVDEWARPWREREERERAQRKAAMLARLRESGGSSNAGSGNDRSRWGNKQGPAVAGADSSSRRDSSRGGAWRGQGSEGSDSRVGRVRNFKGGDYSSSKPARFGGARGKTSPSSAHRQPQGDDKRPYSTIPPLPSSRTDSSVSSPSSSSSPLSVLRASSFSSSPPSSSPTWTPPRPPPFPIPPTPSWSERDATAVAKAQRRAEELAPARLSVNPSVAAGSDVLLGRSLEELQQLVQDLGHQKYRGKQLHQFLYSTRGSDYMQLEQLPKQLREQLQAKGFRVGSLPVHHIAASPDGTAKALLLLEDQRVVEAVGIPSESVEKGARRLTACISSQVGCPLRCSFCATGKGGFSRNLRPHEIVAQVLAVEQLFGQRVSNVVFMGMGEPLLNLPAVLAAHRCLNKDVGIGQRMMTISTVGVPNAIRRLAQQKLQSTLAVSLHAPNQRLRQAIVPSAKAYPMDALLADCAAYYDITGRRISFEYTLLAGVNDQREHAAELAQVLRRAGLTHPHINAIPFNPVAGADFRRPSKAYVTAFVEELERRGVRVTVRQTRGVEANAACGQLRNEFQKSPLTLSAPEPVSPPAPAPASPEGAADMLAVL